MAHVMINLAQVTVFCGLLIFINGQCMEQPDYYWVHYTGEIPADALRATYDQNIYIGQAFLLHDGLLPVTILPGQTTVEVTVGHNVTKSTKSYVTILCSSDNSDRFMWVKMNASQVTKTTEDHKVVGGIRKHCLVHIARTQYKGKMLIGRVYPCREDPQFAFVYNNREIKPKEAEVLVYICNPDEWKYGSINPRINPLMIR